jgi:hypothetical protein
MIAYSLASLTNQFFEEADDIRGAARTYPRDSYLGPEFLAGPRAILLKSGPEADDGLLGGRRKQSKEESEHG